MTAPSRPPGWYLDPHTKRVLSVVGALVAGFVIVATTSGRGPFAVGAPPDDSTADLQAKFDQLKPGETLTLDPGTYQHSGIIYVRVPGVRIDGNGATLQATNDLTSSVQITADNVSLSNLSLTAPLGGPRSYDANASGLVVGANGVTLSDITITGSAAQGVFIGSASNFRLDRVTVRDTLADGIHMMGGANNGQLNNPTTERTGDDGISVVSYTERLLGYRSEPCRNIVINSPVVNGTAQRGIVVAGGENIAFRNIKVSQTSGAGVYIASQGIFDTQSTNGVEVSGGSVTAANITPGRVMGAVAVESDQNSYSVTNATVSNLTISDTPPSAERNIAVLVKDGGAVGNIAFRNIKIQQQTDLPPIYSNAPRDSYTASGFTMNGTAIDVP